MRIDTYQGNVDISFVRLAVSDASMASHGQLIRNELETQLHALGFNAPNKIYAVYYDGTNSVVCGSGAYPPALPGNVGAFYLRGQLRRQQQMRRDRLGAEQRSAVPGLRSPPRGVPHARRGSVVCARTNIAPVTSPTVRDDLMWSGDAVWQLPPVLDVGRDDYFGHGRADCLDLSKSPFLDHSGDGDPGRDDGGLLDGRRLRDGLRVRWCAASRQRAKRVRRGSRADTDAQGVLGAQRGGPGVRVR